MDIHISVGQSVLDDRYHWTMAFHLVDVFFFFFFASLRLKTCNVAINEMCAQCAHIVERTINSVLQGILDKSIYFISFNMVCS